jgi:hypothetical protein
MSVFLQDIKDIFNNVCSSILITLINHDIIIVTPVPKIIKRENVFFNMLVRNNIISISEDTIKNNIYNFQNSENNNNNINQGKK